MTKQEEIVVGDYVQFKSQLYPKEHGLELGQIVMTSTRGTVVVENCFTGRRHYINKGRLVKVDGN